MGSQALDDTAALLRVLLTAPDPHCTVRNAFVASLSTSIGRCPVHIISQGWLWQTSQTIHAGQVAKVGLVDRAHARVVDPCCGYGILLCMGHLAVPWG